VHDFRPSFRTKNRLRTRSSYLGPLPTGKKIDVIATFEDKARSGASVFGRDGLMQLMDAVRQRLFDVVIVAALDRLSRDMEDLRGFISDFHSRNRNPTGA